MALLLTFFLYSLGAGGPVRLDGRKMPGEVIVSRSTALDPKPKLCFPVLMNIFLPRAICVSATKPKKFTIKKNFKLWWSLKELLASSSACTTVAMEILIGFFSLLSVQQREAAGLKLLFLRKKLIKLSLWHSLLLQFLRSLINSLNF